MFSIYYPETQRTASREKHFAFYHKTFIASDEIGAVAKARPRNVRNFPGKIIVEVKTCGQEKPLFNGNVFGISNTAGQYVEVVENTKPKLTELKAEKAAR